MKNEIQFLEEHGWEATQTWPDEIVAVHPETGAELFFYPGALDSTVALEMEWGALNEFSDQAIEYVDDPDRLIALVRQREAVVNLWRACGSPTTV